MKITDYSRHRIMNSAGYWSVDREFFEPLYNYLVHGWLPGSFFTALLANDLFGAIPRSHPGNNIEALKHLCGWIQDRFPEQAWGTYDRVDHWTNASEDRRRRLLEEADLIYTEQQEIMLALHGARTVEPQLL